MLRLLWLALLAAAQDEFFQLESLTLPPTGLAPYAKLTLNFTGCGAASIRSAFKEDLRVVMNGQLWLTVPAMNQSDAYHCLPAAAVDADNTTIEFQALDGTTLSTRYRPFYRSGFYNLAVINASSGTPDFILMQPFPVVRLNFTTPNDPPVDRQWLTATFTATGRSVTQLAAALPAGATLPLGTDVRIETLWGPGGSLNAYLPALGPQPVAPLRPYYNAAAPLHAGAGTRVTVRGQFQAGVPHWCGLWTSTDKHLTTAPTRPSEDGTAIECVLPAEIADEGLKPGEYNIMLEFVRSGDGEGEAVGLGLDTPIVLIYTLPSPPPASPSAVPVVLGSAGAVAGVGVLAAAGFVLYRRRRLAYTGLADKS